MIRTTLVLAGALALCPAARASAPVSGPSTDPGVAPVPIPSGPAAAVSVPALADAPPRMPLVVRSLPAVPGVHAGAAYVDAGPDGPAAPTDRERAKLELARQAIAAAKAPRSLDEAPVPGAGLGPHPSVQESGAGLTDAELRKLERGPLTTVDVDGESDRRTGTDPEGDER
ncbi:MAG TPA: hypothetical protein VKU85_07675 [bacterium]|nr:hypothetical protein [bacterium]